MIFILIFDQDVYYCPSKSGSRAGGLLHNRYYNQKRFKRNKRPLNIEKKDQPTSDVEDCSENLPEFDRNILIPVKDWLKNNIQPLEEVIEKWNQSYFLRRSSIINREPSILIDWPLYKNADLGKKLVGYLKYPNKNNVLIKFPLLRNAYISD